MSHRILIVEDDEAIALGLQINLQHDGYSTELAVDGEAALVKISGWKPALVQVREQPDRVRSPTWCCWTLCYQN